MIWWILRLDRQRTAWCSGRPIPWQIIIFLFFFGMGTAILKDFEDVEGDTEHRVHTIPFILGHVNGAFFSASFLIVAFLLSILFILNGTFALKYALVSVFVVVALANVFFLVRDGSKTRSRKVFTNGMIILTLMELGLIVLRLI